MNEKENKIEMAKEVFNRAIVAQDYSGSRETIREMASDMIDSLSGELLMRGLMIVKASCDFLNFIQDGEPK